MIVFDQIDAAYFRQRALDERERAANAKGIAAERLGRRAAAYEAKARALVRDPLGDLAGQPDGSSRISLA